MTTRTLQLQDISPLLEEIATHFQGWTCVIEDATHDCYAIFTHNDGGQFKLEHSKYPFNERLSVYGIYPETYGCTLHKKPIIKIARYRPAAAIAKEIHRRFLADYVVAFKALEELKRKEDVQRKRGKQNVETLTAVFADCPEQVRVNEWHNRTELNLCSSSGGSEFRMRLEAFIFSKTVNLEFNALPVPIAKQLLEVIRALPPSEA
jgi:hypothetical protein